MIQLNSLMLDWAMSVQHRGRDPTRHKPDNKDHSIACEESTQAAIAEKSHSI